MSALDLLSNWGPAIGSTVGAGVGGMLYGWFGQRKRLKELQDAVGSVSEAVDSVNRKSARIQDAVGVTPNPIKKAADEARPLITHVGPAPK